MRAVILGAGRGSRLGDLTNNKPKPLVEFNGKSLLSRSVSNLRMCKVGPIGIVGGYNYDMVAPYGDELFINNRWDVSGIFCSLMCADEWLSSHNCIITYGDIFYSKDILLALQRSTADIAVAYDPEAVSLWKKRFDDPLFDLEGFTLKHGYIESIGHKPSSLSEIEGQYMGLFKTTPKGWSKMKSVFASISLENQDSLDMTSLFSQLIKQGELIEGIENTDKWGEIDNPSDVTLYEKIYPDV